MGLNTESSYRFERGVDIGGVDWASRRAAGLIAAYAGGKVAPGAVDVLVPQGPPRCIELRYVRVCSLIGLQIPAEEIRQLLASLTLRIAKETDSSCIVEIPTFRGDLEREVDLIEEIARMHGLDKIPAAPPRAEIVIGSEDEHTRAMAEVRACLVGLGLQEIMNYSYTSNELLEQFKLDEPECRVALPNPLSRDHSVLRSSLIPQLVETLGRNAARQVDRAAFFEIGKTYLRKPDGSHHEEGMLAVGLLGPVGQTGMTQGAATAEEAYFWAKGIWESLAKARSVGAWDVAPLRTHALQDDMSMEISKDGRRIGILGILAPSISSEWRISSPLVVLEVSLSLLLEAPGTSRAVDSVSAFPAIRRDVAMMVDTAVTHQQVLSVVEGVRPVELEDVTLFDIFSGENVGEGRKSLAYSFIYRSSERTLTDKDANRLHDRVKKALQKELGAEIRDH